MVQAALNVEQESFAEKLFLRHFGSPVSPGLAISFIAKITAFLAARKEQKPFFETTLYHADFDGIWEDVEEFVVNSNSEKVVASLLLQALRDKLLQIAHNYRQKVEQEMPHRVKPGVIPGLGITVDQLGCRVE